MKLLIATSMLIAVAGCGTDKAELSNTGARLSVDYFGDTDVVGMHFQIDRVACDAADVFTPETIHANVDLVDGIFPGMISLIEQTLDPSSRHLGSDLFLSIAPGCYDVLATPASFIDGDTWTASADCSSASMDTVEVFAGQTTEVTLLSQCVGDPNGALDVLVVLNHPPEIWIEIDEKFNYECEPVRVCATVVDVDDDPIEVEWTVPGNIHSIDVLPKQVIGFESQHRIWEVCAIIVTSQVTSYDITATAFDYAKDGTVKMEDLLVNNPADSNLESRAALTFPIHTNWVEEPLCWDEEHNLVEAEGVEGIDRAKGCSYIDAEEYYCSGHYAVDPAIVAAACNGTTLLEDVFYQDCQ